MSLAIAAGWFDAASYLGLGHVFTANMTGNTVLLAVAAGRQSWPDAVCGAGCSRYPREGGQALDRPAAAFACH